MKNSSPCRFWYIILIQVDIKGYANKSYISWLWSKYLTTQASPLLLPCGGLSCTALFYNIVSIWVITTYTLTKFRISHDTGMNIPNLSLAWRNTYTVSLVPSLVICGKHIHVHSLPQKAFHRTFITRMNLMSYAVLQLHFNNYYYSFTAMQSSMWQELWVHHQRNKILQTLRIKHYILIRYFVILNIWSVASKPHLRSIPHCSSLDKFFSP
jgi:hypothetical protein